MEPKKLPARSELIKWPEDIRLEYIRLKRDYDSSKGNADKLESELLLHELHQFVTDARGRVEYDYDGGKYSVHEERAKIYEHELKQRKKEMEAHAKKAEELVGEVAELKEMARREKVLSKPFKARIFTIPAIWRKYWLSVYESNLLVGKKKSHAAAIAWNAVKIHCVKDGAGEWSCPEKIDPSVLEAIRGHGRSGSGVKSALEDIDDIGTGTESSRSGKKKTATRTRSSRSGKKA